MRDSSPRLWPYAPSNSPVALPEHPLFYSPSALSDLTPPTDAPAGPLAGADLQSYCSAFTSPDGTVDELLAAHDAPPMSERRPFLLLGELANPYRLQDIRMGPLPIFTVRLTDLCRTYADGLDSRDTYPGVHHITVARTHGWWERTHMTMATVEQMKAMITWLDNDRLGTWKPVKPAEGALHFEFEPIMAPTHDEIVWDGENENIEREAPPVTAPEVVIGQVMVPIHIRHGCYDNRGRLARTAHLPQRQFHQDMFRRGSSMKWNTVLKIL
ncbi:MAG: hypothetical protein OSA38_05930 [Candidatus Poseidoniaceae archaeon]|nr:hypothetical protein [Candidatus Poseidoniaceae archaeon]|tara:strand:- start:66 stop:875 length:810 start_codon:yes stop_codon:yes gene_type:complete